MKFLIICFIFVLWMRNTKTIVVASQIPSFPDQYVAKGIIYIPYSEISEPFFAWYDKKTESSRIDYYGGMVKTYQISKLGPFGTLFKIAPLTTEVVMNVDTCFQVNGTADIAIQIQSVLPDVSSFAYIGEEVTRGMLAEKWQYVETEGDRVNKYTLYLKYKKSKRNGDVKIAIPIQFVMKGMNRIFGSHYDHYWIDYDLFSDEVPDQSVFQIGMPCQNFPGPGVDHIYTCNPMKEFVHTSTAYIDSSFENFIHAHNRQYNATSAEQIIRKEIFKHNLRYINSINRAGIGYVTKVNHLADRSPAELKVLRGKKYTAGYNGGHPFPYDTTQQSENLPDTYDWRIYGAVTPVKDQSICGSCWSFGTTGAVEGQYFYKYRRLVRLSQQALIDCSWGFGNNGCDGGEDFRSYEWIMKHGLPTEEDYGPYEGQDGYCHINNVTTTAKITGFVNVTSGDPVALKLALYKNGPISVAIDASHRSFSFYSNGIYFEPKCGNKEDQLDHAVLLVGYGNLNGKDYWLIKNSWSNLWGNDGYVLMSPYNNNCGVMTSPTYVTF